MHPVKNGGITAAQHAELALNGGYQFVYRKTRKVMSHAHTYKIWL